MTNPSFVAVGDIHGCVLSLEALIKKVMAVPHSEPRTWVFLGDYIDRGPSSKQVIDFLLDFATQHDCVFLRGNHEQMLLDAQDTGHYSGWHKAGGRPTVQSYGFRTLSLDLSSQHFHFYRNTRLFLDTPDFCFVHAGMLPNLSVREQVGDETVHANFLWERTHLKQSNVWEKTVVFGHTPKSEPFRDSQMIGLDTGCVYKNLPGMGKLSAVLLPEMKFVSQLCLDKPQPY